MIYFAVDELRTGLLNQYLAQDRELPLRDCMRQITYPELFRTRLLPRGAWIFAALDALSDAELRMVRQIQLAAREAGLPMFNSALEALHRYELLQLLNQSGLNDFRAHRADGPLHDIRYPVFVRQAVEHDGNLTPLLYNRADLRRAMSYLLLRGLPRRQLLVVEFCDTAGADGLYRKYSIFRIGDTYVPRYLHIGPHWMMKSGTRRVDENLILEEAAYLHDNPHEAWVRRVFEMAHIGYGRLDYGVRDGRPQAWEINFTPVLTGNPNPLSLTPEGRRIFKLTQPNKEYALTALREAFLRSDPGPIPGSEIRFAFPPGLERVARCERNSIHAQEKRQQWISRIAAAPGMRAVGPWLRRTVRCLDAQCQ